MAVGTIGVVGLIVQRWKPRHRQRWGSDENGRIYVQRAPEDDYKTDANQPLIKRSKPVAAALTSLSIAAMLFGFNFGLKNYRLMSKIDDAEALLFQDSNTTRVSENVLAYQNEAIRVYRSAIDIDPNAATLHYRLADLLSTMNRYPEAVPEYQEALKDGPNNAKGRFELGTALQKSGRDSDAIREFLRAANLEPGNAQIHLSLANALVRLKQLEAASREYRTVIYIAPGILQAHLNLCSVLVAMHKNEEGLIEGRKAVEMDPKNPVVHNVLGYAYAATGRNRDAAAEMRRVTELKPNLPVGYLGLGKAQVRLNDRPEAIQSFKKFLLLSEGHPQYDAVRTGVQAEIAKLGK